MGADRVGHDILVDLVPDDLLVRLIDLDNLFDPTVDVVREECLDRRSGQAPGAVLLVKATGAAVTVVARDPDQATRLRLLEAGIDLVELDAALRPGGETVDRLDMDMLEPRRVGPEEAVELIVRKGAATIEWRGTTIGFTHQQFPVFLRLLQGARSRSRIASGQAVEDMTGREAKDLVRELRQRVEAAGFSRSDAKSLFKAIHGRGYTLGVSPERISILD